MCKIFYKNCSKPLKSKGPLVQVLVYPNLFKRTTAFFLKVNITIPPRLKNHLGWQNYYMHIRTLEGCVLTGQELLVSGCGMKKDDCYSSSTETVFSKKSKVVCFFL